MSNSGPLFEFCFCFALVPVVICEELSPLTTLHTMMARVVVANVQRKAGGRTVLVPHAQERVPGAGGDGHPVLGDT